MHRRAEHGAPRRFETHGQAARYAATTMAKISACLLVVGAIRVFAGGRPGVLVSAGLALAVWIVGSALIYLYLALASGVASNGDEHRGLSLGRQDPGELGRVRRPRAATAVGY